MRLPDKDFRVTPSRPPARSNCWDDHCSEPSREIDHFARMTHQAGCGQSQVKHRLYDNFGNIGTSSCRLLKNSFLACRAKPSIRLDTLFLNAGNRC